ncbi:MAG: hypothetical protein F6K17_26995, partial [Okeania sp. SIO3C4]|nr:hypothetical protein [Okeania sp. SIO3C4]
MSMNTEELSQFSISFSKLFFEVWIEVNNSNRIKRLDNYTPKIYDQIKLDRRSEKQKKAEKAMNLQREKFLEILLNGFNIPVLVDPDDYVVVKLKDERNNQSDSESDETIFLAFKVLSEQSKNLLKITGLSYKYNTASKLYEYRQGCQAKYLVMFLEQNGLNIPGNFRIKTKITDEMKSDRLRRQFINNEAIKSQDIFKQEQALNGQNAYFYFYLKLINQLNTQENIDENHQFYRQQLQQSVTSPIPDHKIFIDDALSPDSPYYIERPIIDERCKTQIKQPAA